MRKRIFPLAILLVAGFAQAESALTNRAAELQAQAQSDSATVAALPENTRLEVLARKGAWTQVKTANGQTGWVRMMSLKPEGASAEQAAPAPAPGKAVGALAGLLTSGRTSNSATVTTGVRGLGEEDLQNAQANPAELEKMQKFGIDKIAAQAFAQRSKLSPAKVDYLPEPAPARGQERNAEGG